jgi:two-component system NarL family response regulator
MPTSHKTFPSRESWDRCSARTQTSSPEPRIQEILQKADLPLPGVSGNFKRSYGIDPEQRGPVSVPDHHTGVLTVLVADDHPVVREGLVSLISREPGMRVVAEASNGREAVEQFFKHRPAVTLLDLRMAGVDGITALISICEKEPSARIAVISSYQLEEDIYRVLRAGALGYILKDATAKQLAECIRGVAEGKTWVPPQIGARLARRVADRELTLRETQVLSAVAAGKSNKEIGTAFNISESTVKVHMTHILEKLKVTGRTEAINVAVKRGLVHLDLAAAT